ncbi:MAG TPA: heme lyase CcmF/NrfE family subunit [Bacillota bacterium]|nr:heme lyase CcmF/NrfE family subunit [Bacillota bacterium]
MALALALPVAVFTVAALALGLRRQALAKAGSLRLAAAGGEGLDGVLPGTNLVRAGMRSVGVLLGLVAVAIGCLWYAFMTNDFAIQYVADHSARDLPAFYKFTALWGGNEGSLLFWCFILCIWMFVASRSRDPEAAPIVPYATAILAGVAIFFLYILNTVAQPIVAQAIVPANGSGLDTLLQDPYMAIHPPMLYTGFVGFTVPFAFAMGALLSKSRGVAWIRVTRRWALLAFFFLGTGILLGAHWAYHELGWGGYWGWDPVENASFLPWLTGTAFIHSSMIDERRGMLKFWDLLLVSMTFLLTLFGTFLTRSGIVNSVHTFANSGLGPWFMAFIGVVAIFAAWLILDRWDLLKNEHELESVVSKEAAFLFNNVLFLGAAFAVLWGTIFPLITQAVEGAAITVGPPFFNRVMAPVGITLVLLMGIAPLIAWRRAKIQTLTKTFLYPALVGAGYLVIAAALGVHQIGALIATTVSVFAIATVFADAARALKVRAQISGDRPLQNALRLFSHNRHRYGGYLVHIAVALMVIGFAGSTAYSTQDQITLKPGQSTTYHGFTIRYTGLVQQNLPGEEVLTAPLQLLQGGRVVGTIRPGDVFFGSTDTTPRINVGLRSSLEDDLYIVLAAQDSSGAATFIFHLNPLVAWIWIGQVFMMVGTIWALWPERRRRAAGQGSGDLRGELGARAAAGTQRERTIVAATAVEPGPAHGGND